MVLDHIPEPGVPTVGCMTTTELSRVKAADAAPALRNALIALHTKAERAALDAGLDLALIELVKISASQINKCAFCSDMHTKDARAHGETELSRVKAADAAPALRNALIA